MTEAEWLAGTDPGAMLEFASWTHQGFTEKDVAHEAVEHATSDLAARVKVPNRATATNDRICRRLTSIGQSYS